ncbi:MAG TPA: sulfotransferase [Solirubrobacteraceae bacterium]|nr:sulfotransferase [Solirubrobacteraceae bacterium]
MLVSRPDFFIVGNPKCGTTALYEMLKAHPQIYMPELKEPHFFARQPGEVAKLHKRLPATQQEYLALFAPARPGQRVGEASTTYLNAPSAAAQIAALCPDAQIIAILREPASFIRSLHLQLLQSGVETEPDLARALAREAERRARIASEPGSFWRRELLYGEHVHYVEQLRRYHERFGAQRVLTLIYEDFRNDNEGLVRAVLRFLAVDDTFALARTEANPTVRIRRSRANELMHAVTVGRGPVARGAKALVKGVLPRQLRREAVDTLARTLTQREPPPADAALMAELRRRFAGEVASAGEYLERDLAGLWGYDRIQI